MTPTAWDVLGTIFQILAIVIGAYFAWRAFIKKREEFPRATLKHAISHLVLPNRSVLLRTQIEVANSGLVLVKLVSGIFRVDQVLPVPDGLEQGPSEGDLAIDWPPIENRSYTWPTPLEIEPEESEVVVWDVILPEGLLTVQVYTWFKNVDKKNREIGWVASSLYNLSDGRVGEPSTKEFRRVTGSQGRRG